MVRSQAIAAAVIALNAAFAALPARAASSTEPAAPVAAADISATPPVKAKLPSMPAAVSYMADLVKQRDDAVKKQGKGTVAALYDGMVQGGFDEIRKIGNQYMKFGEIVWNYCASPQVPFTLPVCAAERDWAIKLADEAAKAKADAPVKKPASQPATRPLGHKARQIAAPADPK